MIPDPLPLAAAWTAGTAVAAAALSYARVGGPGVRVLIAVVTAAGAATTYVTGAPAPALGALAGVAVATLLVRRPRLATIGWLGAAGAALPATTGHSPVAAIGEAVLLGSITAGLCLGHWFLVDPHLPRGPMRALAVGGLVGLVTTTATTLASGPGTPLLGDLTLAVVIATAVLTALVLVGALFALSVPTYKGVQSATGLFYVSTMSVAGFVLLAVTMRAVP